MGDRLVAPIFLLSKSFNHAQDEGLYIALCPMTAAVEHHRDRAWGGGALPQASEPVSA